MAEMTAAQRDAFLAEPRYAVLSTLRGDGSPVAVPVWFEWDGRSVRMFTHITSGKIKRLRQDARASVLVANHVSEPERWVAFDGSVEVHEKGGMQLAERLAPRYWDVDEPGHKAELESWRAMADDWRVLELVPASIRTSIG